MYHTLRDQIRGLPLSEFLSVIESIGQTVQQMNTRLDRAAVKSVKQKFTVFPVKDCVARICLWNKPLSALKFGHPQVWILILSWSQNIKWKPVHIKKLQDLWVLSSCVFLYSWFLNLHCSLSSNWNKNFNCFAQNYTRIFVKVKERIQKIVNNYCVFIIRYYSPQ